METVKEPSSSFYEPPTPPPIPEGTWKETARNIEIVYVPPTLKESSPYVLECELEDGRGGYLKQSLVLRTDEQPQEGDVLENVYGYFYRQWSSYDAWMSCWRPIPPVIYQTHKSMKYVNERILFRKCMRSWKQYVPEFQYHFFDDMQARVWIQEHMEPRVLQAYNRCPLSVMKADLWRYCILYINGGIYGDIDTMLLCSPSVFLQPKSALVVSLENGVWFCQWAFAAAPGSFILKRVIDLAVTRILEIPEIKGEHIVHYLTGPTVFTDGIELALADIHLGTCTTPEDRVLYYERYKNYVLHVLPRHEFHRSMIHHHFAGHEGWKRQRDLLFR